MGARLRVAVLAWAVLVLGAGCGGGGPGDDADSQTAAAPAAARAPGRSVEGTVLVSAAASLTDAFAELESVFEAANPEAEVQLNLAGSSALREQILEGAPADVFASASQSDMDQVVQAGEVSGDPAIFGRNALQIAVPAGNPGGVSGLEDFAREDLLIGLCAEGVPCGDLGREALAIAGVEPSLDTNEPDVRSLLTKVAAGELDAGLVYVTDVAAAGDLVEGIEIPAEHNVEAMYSIATPSSTPNLTGGLAFVELVLADQGQAILAGFGFAAP